MAAKADATVTPALSVLAVAVLVAVSEKVPLAPLAGAVNVTAASGTGLLFASVTVTASGIGKVPDVGAVCEAPAPALIDAGPLALFVRV
ncbi:MAG: hypothetical protein M3083_08030 [Actinomycetota bacterium]|nr:hypothetical protein [Actinomycetota bacterium]